MDPICVRCRGKGYCGFPCRILARFKEKAPKVKLHFSGSSPPEIFVGRMNYPRVFSGILAPMGKPDEASTLASPEEWIKKEMSIEQILDMRGQLIYGRGESHIKSHQKDSLKNTMQEIALSSKPVSTEFFLKSEPKLNFHPSKVFSIMTNPAPIRRVLLEENPKVEKKVDYITTDYDVKATTALRELYTSNIQTSHLQKLFASGLLGVKVQRKMVPTRWSITAVDDTLGKQILDSVRYFEELNQIELFHHDYNGNHFEVLLLPERWSFEVIEVSIRGGIWNEKVGKSDRDVFMQDYEGFFPRKSYAKNVVGAYYADRLAVSEYLKKIKRQASVLVFHEERPEYYAPLGVGIIRESLRKMFLTSKPENPSSIQEALLTIGTRLHAPIQRYKKMSWLLANYGKQKRLKEFF